MIEVKPGVFYDPAKPYADQSDEFKTYADELHTAEAQRIYAETPTHYPAFDTDGGITYTTTDGVLNYTFKRVQVEPNSRSNRAIKEVQTTINTL